jgi:hypothetical protein
MDGGNPIFVGHHQIQQNDIGLQGARRLHSLFSIRGLTNHFEVWLGA